MLDVELVNEGLIFLNEETEEQQDLKDEMLELHEEANFSKKIEEWDNVQAMMDADYELCKRLQEQEPRELTIEDNPPGSGSLPSNTLANPRGDVKAITTRSGVVYDGPTIPPTPSLLPKEVERETEATKDKPEVAPKPNPKLSIPYPTRLNEQKLCEKANNQMLKFLQIFQRLYFDISFADALLHMTKFASTFKSLLSNKEKLFELASTPLNEIFSAVLLKKLPEKLGDPDKFLIPCDFSELDECLVLADLGASINLMPLFVWKKLSLPELTLTRMTLELANRLVSYPVGVAEDVFVKVGKFYFPADFVVVDYNVDPRVPLILGRPFLRTERALINVHGEELTLRVNDEAITFKVGHTSRYSYKYDDESVNQINVIDVACEEYAQEVLGFSDSSTSGNPTPSDPIIASSSPSFTPFEGGDFILEEIETFLHTPNKLSNLDDDYYDTEGDILYLEKLLNEDPSPNLLLMKNKDLKQINITMTKPSIEEPPELELKDLPSHLEYAFLEDTNKLPVIISKELKDEEMAALLKILMEDDFKPAVQHQRRVSPKIHEVIKKEAIKLLDAGLIYPIPDSPWLNDATREDHFPLPFMDQILEHLAGNEYYCFLDGLSGYFQIPIDPQDQEKTTFTYPYGTFAYRRMPFGLCNALARSKEKCHFMVKEGIILGHKISKSRIEVDRAKVDVIAKLPHLTSVKGVRSFLGHAGFYPFNILKKKLTEAPILVAPDWDLPFEIMCDASDYAVGAVLGQQLLAVVYAFEKFRPYLVLSKTIVYTDHSALKYLLAKQDAKPRLLRWILLLQEFDVIIHDKKGAENLAADHLSRLENPHQDEDEQLIFHVDNTLKHPNKHESINMINFIDITCEDRFSEVLKFKKSNHPSSGSTTPLSDTLLEEFAGELALLGPFPPGNEDDNFDLEADLREIEYLLNQDPSTESSPKSNIEIIDPIIERFTDEPTHIYPPLPRDENDDNDDLFMISLLVLLTMKPEDSLIMGDEDLYTILEKESNEFIKSSVKDLVPIPSESGDTSDSDKECDLPFCDNSVTFSNPLFDANDDFTFRDVESLPEEDVQEENFKIYSNPLFEFDDEYISSDENPLFNEVLEDIESEDSYVSNFDEPVLQSRIFPIIIRMSVSTQEAIWMRSTLF
ncbi:reverse transcriptase domain-containing protein [Tanacetum coccineum]|uniref:RNA-directed DNA polymerase n=1 Tax=Tanacetum coccineum TaxID=301880 RepID=A0ABQ5C8H5_9ASTR